MPRGAAVSGCWLDAGARVDKGDLSLQQEGAATVSDLDLNEGPGVAERLGIGMIRRDEDCTSLSLNRVFKVTRRTAKYQVDAAVLATMLAVAQFARRGPARLSRRIEALIQWLAAFCYLAERGGGRGGVIVNAKFVRLCTLAELNAKGRLLVRGSHRPILVVVDQGHVRQP